MVEVVGSIFNCWFFGLGQRIMYFACYCIFLWWRTSAMACERWSGPLHWTRLFGIDWSFGSTMLAEQLDSSCWLSWLFDSLVSNESQNIFTIFYGLQSSVFLRILWNYICYIVYISLISCLHVSYSCFLTAV